MSVLLLVELSIINSVHAYEMVYMYLLTVQLNKK